MPNMCVANMCYHPSCVIVLHGVVVCSQQNVYECVPYASVWRECGDGKYICCTTHPNQHHTSSIHISGWWNITYRRWRKSCHRFDQGLTSSRMRQSWSWKPSRKLPMGETLSTATTPTLKESSNAMRSIASFQHLLYSTTHHHKPQQNFLVSRSRV